MELARFTTNVFEAGVVKYAAGKHYRIDQDTARQIALGVAEKVDVPVDLDRAEKLAVKAREAQEKATNSALQAAADAQAARDAKQLVEEAEAALAAGQEASVNEMQQLRQKADQARQHAKDLADKAAAAQLDADGAKARADNDPTNAQLLALAGAAAENAKSLALQAQQAKADADQAAEQAEAAQ